MVSFLISSQNGQKGMHQEQNDQNTHYSLLLLINFSEQSYYSKQLMVHGQIEHRQTPTLDLVSSTINNPSLPTTTTIDNPTSPPSPTAPPATTVSTHYRQRSPLSPTAHHHDGTHQPWGQRGSKTMSLVPNEWTSTTPCQLLVVTMTWHINSMCHVI